MLMITIVERLECQRRIASSTVFSTQRTAGIEEKLMLGRRSSDLDVYNEL